MLFASFELRAPRELARPCQFYMCFTVFLSFFSYELPGNGSNTNPLRRRLLYVDVHFVKNISVFDKTAFASQRVAHFKLEAPLLFFRPSFPSSKLHTLCTQMFKKCSVFKDFSSFKCKAPRKRTKTMCFCFSL